MARILYIYAKLNPGLKYVQGMNEILAPLFYVFSQPTSSTSHEISEDVEDITFYCFNYIMSDIKDLYSPELDNTHLGMYKLLIYFIETAILNNCLHYLRLMLQKHQKS